MVAESGGMNAFDEWVRAFVSHVAAKGPVPGLKESERSAATTTHQHRTKAG